MSDPAPTTASSDVGLPSGSTVPQPGSCDPDVERLPAPSIVIGGTSTDSSFGIGAYECGTISGDGYIVYSFNPVLLDASGPIQVRINSGASATLTFGLATFSQTSPGVWESTEPATGCDRLTIDLTSPGGENTATFGADIRLGGADVACPQRTIDPTDPGDIGSVPVATPADNTLPPIATFGTDNTLPSFSGVTTIPATTPTIAPTTTVEPTSTTRR
ncbi:MAG: hypothetical protein JWL72_2038 [Ilumatobacteraceae bacterium]|nr:hypothetical protein [Ilumatobacteraceae bacterium]MCU1388700.1 hypothetical protein [Ilumatobacteraceae bacterium]